MLSVFLLVFVCQQRIVQITKLNFLKLGEEEEHRQRKHKLWLKTPLAFAINNSTIQSSLEGETLVFTSETNSPSGTKEGLARNVLSFWRWYSKMHLSTCCKLNPKFSSHTLLLLIIWYGQYPSFSAPQVI